MWGQFLGHKLVSATGSTASIRAFATKDTVSGQIHILLINKEASSQNVSVAVTGNNGATAASRSVFGGSSASDLTPVYQTQSTVPVVNNSLQATLPAFSITAFLLTRATAVAEPLRAESILNAPVLNAFDLRGRQILPMSSRSGIVLYQTASGLKKTVLVRAHHPESAFFGRD